MRGLTHLLFLLFVLPLGAAAQFAPGAGQVGTTAVYKDSTIFKSWATLCVIQRGFINIEDTTATFTQGDTTSNRAFFGNTEAALGAPGGVLDVVSLGDGGSATLGFAHPITNEKGPDFAVFENGFAGQTAPFGDYLELAFVEVSTDGHHFVRFPSVSLTQDSVQIDGFGQLDPKKIHNLAGKYVANYGTPFDLEDLTDSSGINIDSINFVRIMDVVGDLHDGFARFDSQGHKINDPWPSPYWSGGFDLDAVGVIHQHEEITGFPVLPKSHQFFKVFPIPANRMIHIQFTQESGYKAFHLELINLAGQTLTSSSNKQLNVSGIPNGLYILKMSSGANRQFKKVLIRH
jgi:hypothetical protein